MTSVAGTIRTSLDLGLSVWLVSSIAHGSVENVTRTKAEPEKEKHGVTKKAGKRERTFG